MNSFIDSFGSLSDSLLLIGFLFTYISPLAFVLGVTLLKEAWDDLKRQQRD
jgi:phospholipid-translocating ATPase